MASELLLPLFPLEVVLLPETTLPLHIFEERYKLMIGEAVEQRSEFGIVFSKENSMMNVGCTAAVERIMKRYDDGRLDILTRGQRRFELLFLDEQKPYLRGAVHFFDDEAAEAPSTDAAGRLTGLFRQALGLLPAQPSGSASPAQFSNTFRIADMLPLDLEAKQRLLSSRSEAERVGLMCQYLEVLLPRLERARRAERSARGNGQGG